MPLSTTTLLRRRTPTRAAEQTLLAHLSTTTTLPCLLHLLARILKLGLHQNPLILTKFTSISSTLNSTPLSHSLILSHSLLFSHYSDPSLFDTFLFNTLIKCYSKSKEKTHLAIETYKFMIRNGVSRPNGYTFPVVLRACAGAREMGLGEQVHGAAVRFGFVEERHCRNGLVYMYGCFEGGVGVARKVFDEMSERDCVSWGAMIGGYVRAGRAGKALGLFRRMVRGGVFADEVTMVSVVSACADLGGIEVARWVEGCIQRGGARKDVELGNALIDMFAKCGDVDEAVRVFRGMKKRDIVSWTSVIVGLAMHGRGVEAVSLFEEMKGEGLSPDRVVFIGLLTACSHAGLVEEGRWYFNSMEKEYDVVPGIEHCGCMVDLFCRAGLVREALDFVETMPVEPNPVICRTLINACHAHGDLKLGERITNSLVGKEPLQDSNYVLISNLFAKMSLWDKKNSIRETMEKKGVKKTPGSTTFVLDNEVHEFVAGDTTHKHYKEIYRMLDEMGMKLRKAGYIPATSEVLLDIDEEDKEDALNRHSEKLAIAFALLRTPPGFSIRIVKNLRVCVDCHTATKFISKIYHRLIVMRDRNRFHHFKDGACSCKDYW